MIEALLVEALHQPLAELGHPVVTVSTELPVDLDGEHVQVRATGGPPIRDLVLDERTVAVVCTCPDAVDAARLADDVRVALGRLEGYDASGRYLTSTSCTSPAWLPDPDGHPRYTMSTTILVHNPRA